MFTPIFEKLGFSKTIILVTALIILDVFIFVQVVSVGDNSEIYFFDVGQGDSELVRLTGGVDVLIDGGPPNGKVAQELSRALPFTDRYIDLVMLSHAQLDHFGGLISVLDTYKVGAFLWNGRRGTTSAFDELKKIIDSRGVPVITLSAGDKIKYRDSYFEILSPDEKLLSTKNLNDTSIVMRLVERGTEILFTGDISSAAEQKLADTHRLQSDILKVSHHGSKYSSSPKFLSAVAPALSVIQVGKNSYGHPTKEVLGRLDSIGAQVFRTDLDGTVKFILNDGIVTILRSADL